MHQSKQLGTFNSSREKLQVISYHDRELWSWLLIIVIVIQQTANNSKQGFSIWSLLREIICTKQLLQVIKFIKVAFLNKQVSYTYLYKIFSDLCVFLNLYINLLLWRYSKKINISIFIRFLPYLSVYFFLNTVCNELCFV